MERSIVLDVSLKRGLSFRQATSFIRLLLSLMLLGACSADADRLPTAQSPPPSSTSVYVSPQVSQPQTNKDRAGASELFLAVALGPTLSEASAWDSGVSVYMNRCLERLGFDGFSPMAPLASSIESSLARVDRLYFEDETVISQFGYFWPPVESADQMGAATSEAELAAVEQCGRVIVGLLQELEARIVTPPLDTLDTNITLLLMSDTSLAQVGEAWSECMANRGYPELQAIRPISPDVDTIEVAIADASCQSSTGYRQARISWQISAVEQWIRSNAMTVQAARDYWAERASLGVSLAAMEPAF